MSVYDYFKNIFGGFGDSINHQNVNNEERKNYRDEFLKKDYEQDEQWRPREDNIPPEGNIISQFNLFTDPIEMHRFFEQQMQEVFKAFSMFGGGGNFFGNSDESDESFFNFGEPGNGGTFFFGETPSVEEPSSLRDHFLKPGYKRATGKSTEDSDLDGKINPSDVDTLLKTDPNNSSLQKISPQIRTFGQSFSTRTIRNPDGSMETHKTVRDSSGNEETTIIKQIGDKQHTVTIRTDKHGKQERTEDFVNIDEKDLPLWQQPHPNQGQPYPENGFGGHTDWGSLFDKFFR